MGKNVLMVRVMQTSSLFEKIKKQRSDVQEKIAANDFSSFTIDAAMSAAGAENAYMYIDSLFRQCEDFIVFETLEDTVFVKEILNKEFVENTFDAFAARMLDSYLNWHKPNSTSPAAVEIKLHQHAWDLAALKVVSSTNY